MSSPNITESSPRSLTPRRSPQPHRHARSQGGSFAAAGSSSHPRSRGAALPVHPPPPKKTPPAGHLPGRGAGDGEKGALTRAVAVGAAGPRRGVQRGRRGGRHGAEARLGPGAARTAPHCTAPHTRSLRAASRLGGKEGTRRGGRCPGTVTPAVTPPQPAPVRPPGAARRFPAATAAGGRPPSGTLASHFPSAPQPLLIFPRAPLLSAASGDVVPGPGHRGVPVSPSSLRARHGCS